MNHITYNRLEYNKTKCLKVLTEDHSIVTIRKHIMDINKKCLLNRWVPPSVSTNDELYVIDNKLYHSHYTVCAQKNIVKNNNHIQDYITIQEYLINNMDFNRFDLQYNKAFNIYESSTSQIYECRILYAFFSDEKRSFEKIHWRCYID